VQVNEVGGTRADDPGQQRVQALVEGGAMRLGDLARRRRQWRQRSRRAGARGGDHPRAVAGPHQRPVELRQHLLGAPRRIGGDRCERVGHAHDGQAHAATASASRRQRAAVIDQPNPS
jgi:hypothetical protein